jgi:hypothetical protein
MPGCQFLFVEPPCVKRPEGLSGSTRFFKETFGTVRHIKKERRYLPSLFLYMNINSELFFALSCALWLFLLFSLALRRFRLR